MSRVTRAASRAARVELHDQENHNASINQKRQPVKTIAQSERSILGDIGVNETAQPTSDSVKVRKQRAVDPVRAPPEICQQGTLPSQDSELPHISDGGGRYSRGDIQNKLRGVSSNNGPTSVDETPGDEASQQGQSNNGSSNNAAISPQHIAMEDPSLAVPPPPDTPFKAMTEKIPKFDPLIHERSSANSVKVMNDADDSFEQEIHSRTPSRPIDRSRKSPQNNIAPESDSFVDAIKSRSPAKSVTAVADSIDALDALEDEIERVTEGLPNLKDEALKSPLSPGFTSKRLSSLNPGKVRQTTSYPTNTSQKGNRPMSTSNASTAKRESSAGKSRLSSTTNYPDRRTTISTRKPAFVPSKSNKVPTRPTFTLPGEATSAKQKAQREERVRREEEALRQRREFKARPVRVSGVLPARENATSRARASLAKQPIDSNTQEKKKENIRPGQSTIVSSKRSSSIDPPTKSFTIRPARPSSSAASAPHRSSIHAKPTRSSSTSTSTTNSFSIPGTNGNARLPPKARAKDMLAHDKAETQDRTRDRKEKEEAAKKARMEAAERGRLASREWAEKQRKKKEMAAARLNGGGAGQP